MIILSEDSIEYDLRFKSRETISIQISYTFIDKNSVIVSSGFTDFEMKPIPSKFALNQNYPNPFNPLTTINYDLPKDALVNISIFDVMGREVKTLVREIKQAGYHTINWDSKDNNDRAVSAGIYFYQIQTKDFIRTKKMVLLK